MARDGQQRLFLRLDMALADSRQLARGGHLKEKIFLRLQASHESSLSLHRNWSVNGHWNGNILSDGCQSVGIG